jgi:hypothetical protein
MNKYTISIILIIITSTICVINNVDEQNTEPYHEFNWIDEDEYTINIAFSSVPSTVKCCLWNGTQLCAGQCSVNGYTNEVKCKFTGATCSADPDNPATKYYYSLYCDDTNCVNDKDKLKLLGENAEITVAVKGSSFIHLTFFLLLCLFVF